MSCMLYLLDSLDISVLQFRISSVSYTPHCEHYDRLDDTKFMLTIMFAYVCLQDHDGKLSLHACNLLMQLYSIMQVPRVWH